MTFDELSKKWASVKSEPFDEEKILRIIHSPDSGRVRFRALTRKELWALAWNGLIIIGLVVVTEPFHSQRTTITFFLSLLVGALQAINHFFVLWYTLVLPETDIVEEMLAGALASIRRGTWISQGIMVVCWIALAAILGVMEPPAGLSDTFKAVVVVVMVVSLGIILWQNARIWGEKKAMMTASLTYLEGEEETEG